MEELGFADEAVAASFSDPLAEVGRLVVLVALPRYQTGSRTGLRPCCFAFLCSIRLAEVRSAMPGILPVRHGDW